MTQIDRRSILKGAAGVGQSAALPNAIKAALAIEPNSVIGTLSRTSSTSSC
jgi:hypothetical protein